jgi:hypothetical protein
MMDSFSGKDLPFLGALIAAPGNEFDVAHYISIHTSSSFKQKL